MGGKWGQLPWEGRDGKHGGHLGGEIRRGTGVQCGGSTGGGAGEVRLTWNSQTRRPGRALQPRAGYLQAGAWPERLPPCAVLTGGGGVAEEALEPRNV